VDARALAGEAGEDRLAMSVTQMGRLPEKVEVENGRVLLLELLPLLSFLLPKIISKSR